MTKITTQSGEWLFVEVPEGAHDFSIAKNILGNEFSLKYRSYVHAGKTKVTYGPHSKTKIEFHSSTDTITGPQAAEIVESTIAGTHAAFGIPEDIFLDYYFGGFRETTAAKSLLSLLRKHSLTGRYAILRKL